MDKFVVLEASWLLILLYLLSTKACPSDEECGLGKCIKQGNMCRCFPGFWGGHCQKGRKRLTAPLGLITDGIGQYGESSRLTWLVDSQKVNRTIKIDLESFAAECSWDHLYVFDGRSIYDPLVAVWSGFIDTSTQGFTKRSIFTHSGAAYLYFYSDEFAAGEGFNISYKISQCPRTCSSHGFCNLSGQCECVRGWTGENCQIQVCCPRPVYDLVANALQCTDQRGDCPTEERASHAATLHDHMLWVFGGVSFQGDSNALLRRDMQRNSWTSMKVFVAPPPRHGHTMINYNNYLYIYGGRQGNAVLNDVWRYEISLNVWDQLLPTGDKPLPLVGHAAVNVGNKMYSLLGFSSRYSFTRHVQQFDLATMEWSLLKTEGVVMCGTYGHSAVYDAGSNLIYVFGGYTVSCLGNSKGQLLDGLFTFEPARRRWAALERSQSPRMLHSATIVGGLMYIYGGYVQNSTDMQDLKKKCHENDVIAYSLECGRWINAKAEKLLRNTERYGHTATAYNRAIHVFGGFDGVFKDDYFAISFGNCSMYTTKESCLKSPITSNCAWSKGFNRCLPGEEARLLPASQVEKEPCQPAIKRCELYGSCEACTVAECLWCGKDCNSSCTQPTDVEVSTVDKCDKNMSVRAICEGLSTCFSCASYSDCTWVDESKTSKCIYDPGIKTRNATAMCSDGEGKFLCEQYADCQSCGSSRLQCMWCESQKRCFDTKAYTINFPYGECHAWSIKQACPRTTCNQQKTCQDCFELPGCGWCYDKSKTGIGTCMEGRDEGPLPEGHVQCPASLWHFTECPACQCNGHSVCLNGSKCHSCKDHTTGNQCEVCAPGYYGEAQHNGSCKACKCNGHMKSCHPSTGKCQCDAKGVIGDNCDRCDYDGDYEGNATNGGFCHYRLKLGFQYTFNMTEKTKINFIARPRKTDRDLEFELDVISGGHLYMNLSVSDKSSMTEHFIVSGYRIGKYKEVFAEDDYKFSAEGGVPAFKVYLYGWKQVTAFKISFAQRPSLFDLVYFLIVFVVCFCVLLVIMIVMWKLKQLYESYQYNRRREIEMQEMASRPFGHTTILLSGDLTYSGKREPSAIAVETFAHGKAAVISTFIELPRCSNGAAPFGQSGICIASTLVVTNNAKRTLHGNQQKYIYRDKQKLHHGTAVNV